MTKKERTIYNKAYQAANKERIIAYWAANREEKAIYNKAYRAANKERIAARNKAYRLAHKEGIAAGKRKRRALKYGNKHIPYTGNYIFERDGWICGICGRKINKRLKWPHPRSKSLDHIVPLSKGGNDAPGNVQAAHLRCNLGKRAKNIGQLRLFG